MRIEGLSKSSIYNHWEGQIKTDYSSGNFESISRYKNHQKKGNKNWLDNGEPFFDHIYDQVDVMPMFAGGEKSLMKYLAYNIKFPEEANNNSIQAKVFISFVIANDGYVAGIHLTIPLHPLLGNEGMRLVL